MSLRGRLRFARKPISVIGRSAEVYTHTHTLSLSLASSFRRRNSAAARRSMLLARVGLRVSTGHYQLLHRRPVTSSGVAIHPLKFVVQREC